MFDVSWGEMGVVVGLGLFLIGRKDLPKAARVAGTQVGRVVGMLQGARARADAFAQTNELRALHNEVRSGLRELDAVKAELAVSFSPSQMMQGQRNNLGTMVPSANRNPSTTLSSYRPLPIPPPPLLQSTSTNFTREAQNAQTGSTAEAAAAAAAGTETSPASFGQSTSASNLAPPPQLHNYEQHQDLLYKNHHHHASIAAVAEEEWIKQGIHFRSRAEQGPRTTGQQQQQQQKSPSGSALLSHVLQQSLIFDQYDRVIQDQEQSMQSRMRSIQEKVVQNQKHQSAKDSR